MAVGTAAEGMDLVGMQAALVLEHAGAGAIYIRQARGGGDAHVRRSLALRGLLRVLPLAVPSCPCQG